MVTNEGLRRHVRLEAYRRLWSGTAQMWRPYSDRDFRCPVRHSIDYEANVMKVSFPRWCASNPRWLKFRVYATALNHDFDMFTDDALRDRPTTILDKHSAQSDPVYREIM